MLITFGLRLDAEHGWSPANRRGRPVFGPLRLLNLLETRVGLLRADARTRSASLSIANVSSNTTRRIASTTRRLASIRSVLPRRCCRGAMPANIARLSSPSR